MDNHKANDGIRKNKNTKGEKTIGFVNQRMTAEEQEAFKAKKIPNPGNRLSTLKPSRWTIDREQDVFLVWALQGREELSDQHHFALFWKGTMIPVLLTQTFSGNTCIWDLKRSGIPIELKDVYKEVVQSLKDAIAVYGFNGNPDDQRNQYAFVCIRG